MVKCRMRLGKVMDLLLFVMDSDFLLQVLMVKEGQQVLKFHPVIEVIVCGRVKRTQTVLSADNRCLHLVCRHATYTDNFKI